MGAHGRHLARVRRYQSSRAAGDGEKLYVSDWYHACVRTYTREMLSSHAQKDPEGQAQTQISPKRYTGVVVEWRDHGGYGFIVDDLSGKRFMAHNSDITNSLVQY